MCRVPGDVTYKEYSGNISIKAARCHESRAACRAALFTELEGTHHLQRILTGKSELVNVIVPAAEYKLVRGLQGHQ